MLSQIFLNSIHTIVNNKLDFLRILRERERKKKEMI